MQASLEVHISATLTELKEYIDRNTYESLLIDPDDKIQKVELIIDLDKPKYGELNLKNSRYYLTISKRLLDDLDVIIEDQEISLGGN